MNLRIVEECECDSILKFEPIRDPPKRVTAVVRRKLLQ
jgi:hypothetical protein